MLRVVSVDLLAVNGGRVVNPGINACLVKGRAKVVRVFNQQAILMPSMFGSWPYVWKDDVTNSAKRRGMLRRSHAFVPTTRQTLELDTSNRRNFLTSSNLSPFMRFMRYPSVIDQGVHAGSQVFTPGRHVPPL